MANVYNGHAERIGAIAPDGSVFNFLNQCLGGVNRTGRVFDLQRPVGQMTASGDIYSADGTQVGTVDHSGAVYNWLKQYAGYVTEGVPLQWAGGAALLLIRLGSWQ